MTRRTAASARRAVVCLAVTAAAALSLTMGLPAAAQQPPPTVEELGIDVTAGLGGQRRAGGWTPVEVAVEPTRLLTADLEVSSRWAGGRVADLRAIEAAAGTRRVFRFLVPSGALGVRVVEPGREALELRVAGDSGGRDYLVGVLGAVPEGAPGLRHEPTGLQGIWVPVDRDWLAVSPHALESLAALVVPASGLDDLSVGEQASLAAAVGAGVELVVPADRPGPLAVGGLAAPVQAIGVDGLEPTAAAWVTPAAEVDGGGEDVVAARVPAGHGGVTVVQAAPGQPGLGRDGRFWSSLAAPRRGVDVEGGTEWDVQAVPYQFARLFSEGDATAPALPWLAVFIAAYVLVVGPVNGVVLARLRRRELAWVTVPVVTVTFTLAAFLGVAGGRPSEGPAGRLLASVDGAATEIVVAGVRSPSGGTREIALAGEGWATRLLGASQGTVHRESGVRATLDMAALQLGGVVASRATDTAPPLSLTATAGADGVVAVVRNEGGTTLSDVVVRAATASARLGSLVPGEEQEVHVGGPDLPTAAPHRDPFEGLPAGPPRSFEALLRHGLVDGDPGLVWAVATAPAGNPDLTVDGRRPLDRGLLLAVGVTPSPGDAGVPGPFAVRRDLVVTQRHAWQPSPQAVEGVEEAFLGFRLPAGDLQALRARFVGSGPGLDHALWDPARRSWVPADEAIPDGVGDTGRLVDPFGQVWMRLTGELYPLNFSGFSVDGTAEGAT